MGYMNYLLIGLWIYMGVKLWRMILLRKERYGAVLHGQISTQLAAFWAVTITYLLFAILVVMPII